jgi:hypothetical protein
MRPALAAVAVSLCLQAASPAFADVPTINIDATCGMAATAMVEIMGGSSVETDRNICLSSEQNARNQISKDWASYSAQDKARCVQTDVYLPSYVEWLTCLEMERDVRKMRINQPNPRAPVTLPKVTPGTLW